MIQPDDTQSTECLTPECSGRVGYINGVWHGGRGLCKQCHGVAARLVKQKKVTWIKLEQMGLAKPPRNPSPFLTAYENKLRESP